MQGMPAKLLTQRAVQPAVKGDVKSSSESVNNKMATGQSSKAKAASEGTPDIEGEASKAESKNSFADLFSGLIGNEANKVEGKGEKVDLLPVEMAAEVKAQSSAETKLDSLLKVKGQNQGTEKNNDISAMTAEQALTPEVLQSINKLLAIDPNAEAAVSDKVTSAASNLDQLLKSLRGDKVAVPGEEVLEVPAEAKDLKSSKAGSPLDFLLKQSKESDLATTNSNNPEMVSKLGLSSEDFLSHMNVKDGKNTKGEKLSEKMDLEGQKFDPKELLNKQMNASMKSYGQKQNLLDNGLIKNTNDLAFKETISKASSDELKSPDMKIGAELSQVKEHFIPVMNKEQNSSQMESQNAGKVLDISKMDTANHTEIIKRISDYVQQSQVANSNSLDLTVRHDSLGEFKIQVNKPMDPRSNQMDMQITTSTAEGHDFFVKNEIGLMKNLNQAGIQLSDLRIVSGGESMSFTQSDSRQSGHNNSQQGPRESMSFDSGDFSQGSDRRRELWQEARANQQRYGA